MKGNYEIEVSNIRCNTWTLSTYINGNVSQVLKSSFWDHNFSPLWIIETKYLSYHSFSFKALNTSYNELGRVRFSASRTAPTLVDLLTPPEVTGAQSSVIMGASDRGQWLDFLKGVIHSHWLIYYINLLQRTLCWCEIFENGWLGKAKMNKEYLIYDLNFSIF